MSQSHRKAHVKPQRGTDGAAVCLFVHEAEDRACVRGLAPALEHSSQCSRLLLGSVPAEPLSAPPSTCAFRLYFHREMDLLFPAVDVGSAGTCPCCAHRVHPFWENVSPLHSGMMLGEVSSHTLVQRTAFCWEYSSKRILHLGCPQAPSSGALEGSPRAAIWREVGAQCRGYHDHV